MTLPQVDPKTKPKAMNCDCDYCKVYKGSVKKPAKWDLKKQGDHTAAVFINRCSTQKTWVLEPFSSGQDFIKACVALERNYMGFSSNSVKEKSLGLSMKVVTTSEAAQFMQDHLLSQDKFFSLAYLDLVNPKAKELSIQNLIIQSYEMLMKGGFVVARTLKKNKSHTSHGAMIDSIVGLTYMGCVISYDTSKQLLLNYIWKKEK